MDFANALFIFYISEHAFEVASQNLVYWKMVVLFFFLTIQLRLHVVNVKQGLLNAGSA